jgi:ATP-dependent DNA ligase
MNLPVPPPVKPMLAKPVDGFDALPPGQYVFEPKWDGFRCIVFRDGDTIELGSRNERPLTRYFPELVETMRAQLPDRCVLDGEVVVIVGDALDFDALGQRIHPADSRVQMLSVKTPATFVAFDALAIGDRDLRGEPFHLRRQLLEQLMTDIAAPLHLCPTTDDRVTAQRWFDDFEGAGLDGLIAKPLDGTYVEDKRVQFKLKHLRTADCVVAGFRWHKDGEGVGSLLLGVYDDDGTLHHVGVAASFAVKRRKEFVELLQPLTEGALANHPWKEWADAEAHESGRMPGAPSRWQGAKGGKDMTWVPVRLERVVEVSYQTVTNGRFRGVTHFERWRPDRTVSSCHYSQLVQPEPLGVDAVLGGTA